MRPLDTGGYLNTRNSLDNGGFTVSDMSNCACIERAFWMGVLVEQLPSTKQRLPSTWYVRHSGGNCDHGDSVPILIVACLEMTSGERAWSVDRSSGASMAKVLSRRGAIDETG